jgi:hypothetical protein
MVRFRKPLIQYRRSRNSLPATTRDAMRSIQRLPSGTELWFQIGKSLSPRNETGRRTYAARTAPTKGHSKTAWPTPRFHGARSRGCFCCSRARGLRLVVWCEAVGRLRVVQVVSIVAGKRRFLQFPQNVRGTLKFESLAPPPRKRHPVLNLTSTNCDCKWSVHGATVGHKSLAFSRGAESFLSRRNRARHAESRAGDYPPVNSNRVFEVARARSHFDKSATRACTICCPRASRPRPPALRGDLEEGASRRRPGRDVSRNAKPARQRAGCGCAGRDGEPARRDWWGMSVATKGTALPRDYFIELRRRNAQPASAMTPTPRRTRVEGSGTGVRRKAWVPPPALMLGAALPEFPGSPGRLD